MMMTAYGRGLMPREGKQNAEVGEIVQTVRGRLSYEQAAIRIKHAISGNAIRILEGGKIGREATVRAFAEGFWERFCDSYSPAHSRR